MEGKKWVSGLVAVIIVSMLLTGYLAIAAEFGSKEDPLVTLSYITEVLSPDTMEIVDGVISEKVKSIESKIDEKIADYADEVDRKLSEFEFKNASEIVDDDFISAVAEAVVSMNNAQGNTSGSSEWTIVKVGAGKTILLPLGSEVVPRGGTAVCYASGSPGMINLSDGSVASDGDNLKDNNLYLVTVEGGRGIKASTDTTLMVSGKYELQ